MSKFHGWFYFCRINSNPEKLFSYSSSLRSHPPLASIAENNSLPLSARVAKSIGYCSSCNVTTWRGACDLDSILVHMKNAGETLIDKNHPKDWCQYIRLLRVCLSVCRSIVHRCNQHSLHVNHFCTTFRFFFIICLLVHQFDCIRQHPRATVITTAPTLQKDKISKKLRSRWFFLNFLNLQIITSVKR